MLRYENTVVVALDDLPYLNSFPFEYNSPQWKEFMRSDDKGNKFYVSRDELLIFLDAFEKKYGLDDDEEPYHTFVGDALFLFTDRLFDIRVDRTHLVFD